MLLRINFCAALLCWNLQILQIGLVEELFDTFLCNGFNDYMLSIESLYFACISHLICDTEVQGIGDR